MTAKKRGRPAKTIPNLVPSAEFGYCRRCMKTLPVESFYKATDELLDTSGRMSVCKNCIEEFFLARLQIDINISAAVLFVCRALNIYYDEKSIDETKKEMDTRASSGIAKDMGKFFGRYKAQIGRKHLPPYFIEPLQREIVDGLENVDEDEEFKRYLVEFWGEGLTVEQYNFLENEMARWKRTHRCDNTAEETLLREICFTALEIREGRQAGRSSDGSIKRLQDLMKTASLDPAKANAASSGKSAETFGEWIKEIEEKTPAEWFDEQEKFRDMDGLADYLLEYITRPIRNFITGSRDFNTSDFSPETSDDEEDVLDDDAEE